MSAGAAPQRDASGPDRYRVIALGFNAAARRLVGRVAGLRLVRDERDLDVLLANSVAMSRALSEFARDVVPLATSLREVEAVELEVDRFRRELEGM